MIQWTDAIKTGHAQVDAEHKQLIEALNDLESALRDGAAREHVGKIIDFLNSYTRQHFAHEEVYMDKVQCPSREQNCREHALLISRLDSWIERYQAGASLTLILEIHRELANWVTGHILKIDCKLRGCRGS